MGVCGAADHEDSGLSDGVKLSDCLRKVPKSNIHNYEYQYLAALSAFRPQLERGTYRLVLQRQFVIALLGGGGRDAATAR